jgi:multicomponent K+:H+ antiporter subunit D
VSSFIVAPILLPALAGPLLVLLRLRPDALRWVSALATAALLGIAVTLYATAADSTVRPYLLGAWPAPFGIVLVLDRLSATMVLLTSALACAALLYAIASDWDRRGRHFHALFQFQLAGLNGAFLTGDVFNLFVFFEVMLIASYGLLVHGGGPRRLGAGLRYVVINLVGSTLFLFAVGLIYAVTGTLNMADLAARAAQVQPGDAALLRTGVLLLFAVFALKAALVPLHWWLPTAYAAAPAPAAAIFMAMTKVGAYAIIRVHGLVFGAEAGPVAAIAAPWLLPAALATLAIGAIGVLASRRLTGLVAFAVVWSMGSLLVAVSLFDARGIAAALYYAVHSTLAGAALFLIADVVTSGRTAEGDRIVPAPAVPRPALVGALFALAAIAMAGLPPLSGFIGKLLILQATQAGPMMGVTWTVLLGSSLVVIVGMSRAGSTLFWKTTAEEPAPGAERATPWALAAAALLIAGTALLTVAGGPVTDELAITARQALDRDAYVAAVLGRPVAALTGEEVVR